MVKKFSVDMKKYLTLALSALLSLTAFAQNKTAQIVPEGEPHKYELSCVYIGNVTVSSMAMAVSFNADSTKIYFRDLFPYYRTAGTDIWTAGDAVRNADGTRTVTIPLQYVNEYRSSAGVSHLWVGGVLDENITELGDIQLTMKKDGSFVEVNPEQYMIYAQMEQNTQTGNYDLVARCAYHNHLVLKPLTANAVLNEPPSTATFSDYIYNYNNSEGTKQVHKGTVAIDGQDVYFNYLSPATSAWVKGTMDEVVEGLATVHIPTNQYLGDDLHYNLFLKTGHMNGKVDDEGYSLYDMTKEATFLWDEATGIFDLDADDLLIEALYAGNIYAVNYKFSIQPLKEETAVHPTDPYKPYIYDMTDSEYGETTPYCFMFYIDNKGTNDELLDTEKLFYYIYVDDEILEFDRKSFTHAENQGEGTISLIPFNFTDENFGNGGARHWVYLGEDLFNTLGVQAVYVVDGVEYRSHIVKVDLDGKVTVVDDETDGITSVRNEFISDPIPYDLSGRRVQQLQPGQIYIKEGKKMIVK